MASLDSLAAFIKYQREKSNLTQEDLAAKAGVGIHLIRNIEQGKGAPILEKMDKILGLFGYQVGPVIQEEIDAYQIWFSYKGKAVEITLINKTKIVGFLAEEMRDHNNTIQAWRLIPFPDMLEWQKTQNDDLSKVILQDDIDTIELFQHG